MECDINSIMANEIEEYKRATLESPKIRKLNGLFEQGFNHTHIARILIILAEGLGELAIETGVGGDKGQSGAVIKIFTRKKNITDNVEEAIRRVELLLEIVNAQNRKELTSEALQLLKGLPNI